MRIIGVIIFLLLSVVCYGQSKTIHVFVALCDNANQGIVPVPERIGNGQDPKNNLYWGAGYGVKTFFKVKTKDWTLIRKIVAKDANILERLLFKHVTKDVYLLADAYDGAKIKTSIEDFLKSSNGQSPLPVEENNSTLYFGGNADLLAYVGHDGLMDFDVSINYEEPSNTSKKDVIILACYSKAYFAPEIKKAKANPILWTTHLMAPEAYTLKAAIDGWILNESGKQIDERAAQSYHKYQKCGIKGARNLFTTGF